MILPIQNMHTVYIVLISTRKKKNLVVFLNMHLSYEGFLERTMYQGVVGYEDMHPFNIVHGFLLESNT